MTAAGLLRDNPTATRRGDSRRTRRQPVSLHRLPQHRHGAVQVVVWQMAHTTEMPALVAGDVIPPESLPGGILSSPTGAEITVPTRPKR